MKLWCETSIRLSPLTRVPLLKEKENVGRLEQTRVSVCVFVNTDRQTEKFNCHVEGRVFPWTPDFDLLLSYLCIKYVHKWTEVSCCYLVHCCSLPTEGGVLCKVFIKKVSSFSFLSFLNFIEQLLTNYHQIQFFPQGSVSGRSLNSELKKKKLTQSLETLEFQLP